MNDCLGQELEVNDYVAGLYSSNETPDFFKIIGFTPKKARLNAIADFELATHTLKFGYDLLKVDSELVESLMRGAPLDALGQVLEVGDSVYGSDGDYIDPVIYEIESFVPGKAKLKRLISKNYARASLYTADLIKIDQRLVTMFMLTKDHK